jgi:hypothetical protein
MARQRAPSARQAQEMAQLCEGQSAAGRGEELCSALVRLSTARVLQEALDTSRPRGSAGTGTSGGRQ